MEYDQKNMCDFVDFFINLLFHIHHMDAKYPCVAPIR
jgi:hypothetical protein